MAIHSAPAWLALRVRLPRGYHDFWRLIRERDAHSGDFTVDDIDGETNGQRQSVEHYIARLCAGGFAKVVERRVSGGVRMNVYRLLRRPKAAPRLRDDGSEIAGITAQERLWIAMRTLRQFSACEAAELARVKPLKTAQRYINELARAGYLTTHGLARRPKLYRFKPGMNTGPLPPSVLVTEAVWDRNLKRVVGEPRAALRGDAS